MRALSTHIHTDKHAHKYVPTHVTDIPTHVTDIYQHTLRIFFI